MKKILLISPYNIFPPYWGAATRNYYLAKHLANKYKIFLLCNNYKQLEKHDANSKEFLQLSSNPNVQVSFVKSLGKFSQIFNPLVVIKGLKIIKKERPDFIIAENVWSGLHAAILSYLGHVPYILDEHNVEFLRFDRMKRGSRVARFFLKTYETLSCKFAYRIFCVSEVDRDLLISKLNIRKDAITIIPNGIDTDKFYPNQQKSIEARQRLALCEKPVILFFGKLDYIPNYEAVKIIRYEILPRILKKMPEAKFLIVGDNPPSEFIHEKMIFTGLVEKIEEFINLADIVICPILSGGGTRFKILEALACEKIVISTTIGAEGLTVKGINENLIIRDDWDSFSNEIVNSISRKNTKIDKEFIDLYSWKKSSLDIIRVLES